MSVITVGKGQQYSSIASAASHVASGDTLEIFAGTYAGAAFSASNITIEGMEPGVVVNGPVVQSKGLFVFSGKNVTVDNITFENAVDSDGNGAGIRFQGTNLTVLNSTFLNNQDGILTDPNGGSTVIVKNSTFNGNGSTAGGSKGAAHALYVGSAALLDVENSTFTNTKQGHDIKSRAKNTVIENNSITDGSTGTSSYLIDIPNGGAATITGNALEKGPHSSNPSYAITIGEEGATNPAGPILIANNTFQNDDKAGVVFAHNQTGNPDFTLTNNTISGLKTTVLTGQGTVTTAAPAVHAQPRDFNGDGKSDILMMDSNSSTAQIYTMNGLSMTSSASITGPAATGWSVVATGDFNGDKMADLVWQSNTTQDIVIDEMNGSTVLSGSGPISVSPGTGMKVVTAGDFNGDGTTDLLLQKGSSLEVMLMNGTTVTGSSTLSQAAPSGFRVVGTGDFNGDGKADILFQSTTTGQMQIWEMDGTTVTSTVTVTNNPGSTWKAYGTGDFNGDGNADILLQNTTTGQVGVWIMNGAQYGSGGGLSTKMSEAGWHVTGTGDYNGDGKSDIVFRNNNGAVGVWEMSGTTYLTGSTSLGISPGTSFHAVAG
jgi:hypothetical protein